MSAKFGYVASEFGINVPPDRKFPKGNGSNVKRDPKFKHDPNLVRVGLMFLETDENKVVSKNLLLSGDAGCGKSKFAEQLAAVCEIPMYQVNFATDSDVDGMFGRVQVVLENGVSVTKFVFGPIGQALVRAQTEQTLLVLDELNQAGDNVMGLAQLLTHTKVTIALTGEVFDTSKLYVIATGNAIAGDERLTYRGVSPLNSALLSRFWHYPMDYLSPEDEVEVLLMDREELGEQTAELMVAFAGEMRSLYKKGHLSHTFSTRSLIMWSRGTVNFGKSKVLVPINMALEMAWANHHAPKDREVVLQCWQRLCKEGK